MRLGKTAVVHFSSQVVVSLAGFLATFAIAYLLGPDGLGRYAIAVAIGYFWLAVPLNAVGMAVKKRMSEGTDAARYFGAGLALNGLLTAVIAGLVLVVGFGLARVGGGGGEFVAVLRTYSVEIAALVAGSAVLDTFLAGLEGRHRVGRAGGFRALERIARTGVQVGVLLAGFGVAAITLGHAASLVGVAVVGLATVGLHPARPRLEHLRGLVTYARYAWMSTLRGRVFGWLDTIVLSLFVSASLVGIYEAAWGVASLLAMASTSIGKTLFPEVSELSVDDGFERITHYLDEALAFSGVFIVPGFVGAVVLGDRVLTFYRPEFGRGTGVLLILIAAYAANAYGSQFLNVVNAVDRPDLAFRVNVAFVLLNGVLNLGLVWAIGWYGAAIATAASATLRLVLGYVAVRRVVGVPSVPYREIVHQAGAALGMALVVGAALPLAPNRRVGTVLLVGLGAAVYLGILVAVSARVRTKARGLAPFPA